MDKDITRFIFQVQKMVTLMSVTSATNKTIQTTAQMKSYRILIMIVTHMSCTCLQISVQIHITLIHIGCFCYYVIILYVTR
jgi:hypothetical protein